MCVALPARIVSVENGAGPGRPGLVDMGGTLQNVDLLMTPDAEPGEYVIVHSGFALRVIAMRQALEIQRLLSEGPE